jgi:hypothetical protein
MTGFTGTSIRITTNYNQLQQLTINDCLRLVPFLTALRVSSTVTELDLIYESVTSSASVVRWLTLHSWTLKSLTTEFFDEWIEWRLSYECFRWKSKSHCDWQSVSQSGLVSSPIWGSWPVISYCVIVSVLSLWGALSDERSGLSFVRVIVNSHISLVWKNNIFTFYMFHMFLNAYTIYTRPLSVQAQCSRVCPISSSFHDNGNLVTWTVVCLTAAKFKPHMFSAFVLVCAATYIASGLHGKCWLLVRIRGNLCWFRWHGKRVTYQVALNQSASP